MGSVNCCCEADGIRLADVATPVSVDAKVGAPADTAEYLSTYHQPTEDKEIAAQALDEGRSVKSHEDALPRLPLAPEAEATMQTQPPMPPPPAKEEPVAPAKPDTFLVSIHTNGGKLGFGVGHKPGESTLHVVKVQETGCIPEWNKNNPDKQVTVGCRIVEINGSPVVPQDQEVMMKEISDACRQPFLSMLVEKSPQGGRS
mmetsp:Transcript_25454/g.59263  ORF Transcript_25454/g.59263 Transcript_25454/m.59263 type:complete len:201 (+) Transcript_25454:134-736(+)